MTREQITKRLDERRAELEIAGTQLNQIQKESVRLSVWARKLQGAIAELEDMLKDKEAGET